MNGLPRVDRDDSTSWFFEAAARGELVMRRGPSGSIHPPEARVDTRSGSTGLEPVTVSGSASLVSWTVVHQAPHPALADAVPYVSAVVELTEGPWLIVRLRGDETQLRAGAPLQVCFAATGPDDDPGEYVPVFELV